MKEKDVRTDISRFFVRCRRTYILNKDNFLLKEKKRIYRKLQIVNFFSSVTVIFKIQNNKGYGFQEGGTFDYENWANILKHSSLRNPDGSIIKLKLKAIFAPPFLRN